MIYNTNIVDKYYTFSCEHLNKDLKTICDSEHVSVVNVYLHGIFYK